MNVIRSNRQPIFCAVDGLLVHQGILIDYVEENEKATLYNIIK